MKSTGPAREALEPEQRIITQDRPIDHEKMAMLKFMEDELLVQIHPSTNPLDEEVFQVFNNGEAEFFRRGEQKKVKRKFINILAQNKLTTYTQKRVRNADGVMQDVQVPHTAIRYGFSILHDPHPRGQDWFRAMLAQP